MLSTSDLKPTTWGREQQARGLVLPNRPAGQASAPELRQRLAGPQGRGHLADRRRCATRASCSRAWRAAPFRPTQVSQLSPPLSHGRFLNTGLQSPLHSTPLRSALLHSAPLHSTPLHSTPLHKPHSTALHCTALHCTTLHGTTLHRTALQSIPFQPSPPHPTPPHPTPPHPTPPRPAPTPPHLHRHLIVLRHIGARRAVAPARAARGHVRPTAPEQLWDHRRDLLRRAGARSERRRSASEQGRGPAPRRRGFRATAVGANGAEGRGVRGPWQRASASAALPLPTCWLDSANTCSSFCSSSFRNSEPS
jgi:hypothetical protein